MIQHFVNLSGGKDSQATALVARERGVSFRLVMADTGNENQLTMDHAHYLADFLGLPLEIVKYDFSEKIAKKRDFVRNEWVKAGVSQARIDRALEILKPTGNPFLDLCIWKGRFPSRRAQFCTEFLKSRAVMEQVIDPALRVGGVIQWIGVRRDESPNRKNTPMFRRVRQRNGRSMVYFSPLIHWTVENVLSFSEAFGTRHNPLYTHGMRRVGCFPCINSGKHELREIFRRFPDTLEKLTEWETLVADASKRGAATFFPADTTPQGAEMVRQFKKQSRQMVARQHPELLEYGRERDFDRAERQIYSTLIKGANWPDIRDVAEWAKTDTGGRQFNMLDMAFAEDEGPSCSSQYGLCE